MLVLRNRIVEVPIMSLQTGTQLGISTEPIVDPRNLTIVAFYCEGPTIDFSPAILHVEDIREFSDIGFIVDNSDSIMPADDLVRLKEIMSFKFSLEGKTVVQEDHKKLGKVSDYAIDVDSFYVLKLHIKPTFMQSLTTAEHIVDRRQIKSITDKEIIVSRPTIQEAKAIPAVGQPPLENPFRKRHVEVAETSDPEILR